MSQRRFERYADTVRDTSGQPVDLPGHDVLFVDETPTGPRETECSEHPVGQEDGTAGIAARGDNHAGSMPHQVEQALKNAESGAGRESQERKNPPARRQSPCMDQVYRIASLRHEGGFHPAPCADVHDPDSGVPGSDLVGNGQTRIDVAARPAPGEYVGHGSGSDRGVGRRRCRNVRRRFTRLSFSILLRSDLRHVRDIRYRQRRHPEGAR